MTGIVSVVSSSPKEGCVGVCRGGSSSSGTGRGLPTTNWVSLAADTGCWMRGVVTEGCGGVVPVIGDSLFGAGLVAPQISRV